MAKSTNYFTHPIYATAKELLVPHPLIVQIGSVYGIILGIGMILSTLLKISIQKKKKLMLFIVNNIGIYIVFAFILTIINYVNLGVFLGLLFYLTVILLLNLDIRKRVQYL